MFAIYIENNIVVENDFLVDEAEAYDWFMESYLFHTGRKATSRNVRNFMGGEFPAYATTNKGNLRMEWSLRK